MRINIQHLTLIIKKIILGIVVAFFASTILSVVILRWIPVYFTPLMFIRVSQQISAGQETKLRHHWVPYEEISPSLSLAVMASEDARFQEHNGFDYKAIEHAAMRPLASRRPRTFFCGLVVRGYAKVSRSISRC